MNPAKIAVARYLKGHGLHQGEIADLLGEKSHQNIGYHMRKLRSAFIDKDKPSPFNQAGVVSLLVGYVSDPCLPSLECPWCNREEYGSDDPNHYCPRYVQSAAYAQMEDLTKEQKIGVLLALLQEVEQE